MRLRFVVVLLFICTSIAAQTTTSVLTGRVTTGDADLGGVNVTVESAGLQGTRTAQTAPDGTFVFPALPPGTYTVRFTHEGMQSVAKRAELHLAETTRVDAALQPLVAEELTVVPAPATVLETPQVSANFDQSFIRLLPIGRAILDIARIAPGVHDSGPNRSLTINGAAAYDNLYLVNGATISDPLRGTPHNLFIEDAIQETTIITGSVSAEYGRFLGGVVSVITKSGGNATSGTIRDTLSSDRWTAHTPFANEAQHLDRLNHDYEATLGGRVVRDRLWFFLAGRYQQRRDARSTFVTFLPYEHGSNEARYEGKLTANLATNHTIVGSYLNVKAKELNAGINPADFRALFEGETPNSLTAVSYTGILSQNAVVEAQFTRKYFAFTNFGATERDLIFGTSIFDNNSVAMAWAPPFCSACPSEHRNNREVAAKASFFFPSSRIGTHNIVAGASDFHERNNRATHQSGSDFQVYGAFDVVNGQLVFSVIPDETFIVWAPILFPSGTDDYATTSAYVNDRIDWGRHFSFNAGLRYDKSKGEDQLGQQQMDGDRISQRLSVTYDVRGDGAHRIAASYSRYAGRILPGIGFSASSAGVPATLYWAYEGPAVNDGSTATVPTDQVLKTVFDWFKSVGGVDNEDFLIAKRFSSGQVIESALKAPAMDEWVLGYGLRFGRSAFLRADYISRKWHDFYTQRVQLANGTITDEVGNTLDKVIIENSNDNLKREYNGVSLQGHYAYKRFTAGGNYTWSRLWGNVESENAGSGAIAIPNPGAYYPEYVGYANYSPMGYLSADERNRANVWIGYDMPTQIGRFNVSLLQVYHSGRRYSAVANADLRTIIKNPGYLNPTGLTRYYYSKRGGLQVDDIASTGVALNWARGFGRFEGFIETDILNVFDNDGIENPAALGQVVTTGRTDRNLAAFNPFTATPKECPQGVKTTDVSCKGIANYQLSATFGKPVSKDAYQAPRTFRISLGLRF